MIELPGPRRATKPPERGESAAAPSRTGGARDGVRRPSLLLLGLLPCYSRPMVVRNYPDPCMGTYELPDWDGDVVSVEAGAADAPTIDLCATGDAYYIQYANAIAHHCAHGHAKSDMRRVWGAIMNGVLGVDNPDNPVPHTEPDTLNSFS